MTYSLQPELKQALARLPLHERVVTRARLHARLTALSRTDDAICALFNRYDCGASLIDQLTGGQLYRLRSRMAKQEAAVAEITHPLLEWGAA